MNFCNVDLCEMPPKRSSLAKTTAKARAIRIDRRRKSTARASQNALLLQGRRSWKLLNKVK